MVTEEEQQQISDSIITRMIAAGMINPKKQRKVRVNWEAQLAREYIAKFFKYSPVWYRKEVGFLPGDGVRQDYSRVRKWVDAIVRTDEGIKLIEFKMKPKIEALSQLDNYRRLFPETPEFVRYKDEHITCRVVTTMDDSNLKIMAEEYGFEYDVFKPSNWEEWYVLTFKPNNNARGQ